MSNSRVWEPLGVEEIVDLFAGVRTQWWVSGGVALDLFIGHPTRQHHDIDIEIPRAGLDAMLSHLPGWDPHTAHDGKLRPLGRATDQPPQANGVWWRVRPASPWRFDLKLARVEGTEWVYRRHPRVQRPLKSVWWTNREGVPLIAPEVQLLFNAAADRPTDTNDAKAVIPLLDPQAHRWLIDAIRVAHPDSRWLHWL